MQEMGTSEYRRLVLTYYASEQIRWGEKLLRILVYWFCEFLVLKLMFWRSYSKRFISKEDFSIVWTYMLEEGLPDDPTEETCACCE